MPEGNTKMNKLILTLTLLFIFPLGLQAQSNYKGEFEGLRFDRSLNAYVEVQRQPVAQPRRPAPRQAQRSSSVMGQQSGLLYQKSLMQASRGRMGHVMRGQYVPSARAEGVGFSTISAQDALRRCCYMGQRPLVGYSVVRGRRGYFATAQYR